MSKQGKSIYHSCRNSANMSREQASEILGISTESLGAYERGETRIPCDIVVKMAESYGDPTLPLQHMKESGYCPMQRFIPEIRPESESSTVLTLLKEHADVGDLTRKLISGAYAGSMAVLKEVDELASACMSFKFMFMKKERTPDVGTIRGSARSKPA